MYVWSVIGPYALLVQITTFLSQWNVPALCSGVQLELESPDELGTKQEWMLTLRIRGLNSGAGIKVSSMLYSMNFEVESTSPIYCDGWIGTQYEWRLKDLPDLLLR